MTKPITPKEALKYKEEKSLPPEVLEAFNNMITKHYDGKRSHFTETEVVDEMVVLLLRKDCSVGCESVRSVIYKNKWLDVEAIYRKAGWVVEYDHPGWNESYEPTYKFSHSPWRGDRGN